MKHKIKLCCINVLQQKVAGMVSGQRRGGGESENFVVDEGQSSESVTYVCNSTGPPQDYESSDTSLKLGSVFIYFGTNIQNSVNFTLFWQMLGSMQCFYNENNNLDPFFIFNLNCSDQNPFKLDYLHANTLIYLILLSLIFTSWIICRLPYSGWWESVSRDKTQTKKTICIMV